MSVCSSIGVIVCLVDGGDLQNASSCDFSRDVIIMPCQSNLSREEQSLMFFAYMKPVLKHLNFVSMIMSVCVLGGPRVVVMHVDSWRDPSRLVSEHSS